jgi:hypothetical protein
MTAKLQYSCFASLPDRQTLTAVLLLVLTAKLQRSCFASRSDRQTSTQLFCFPF